MGGTGFDRASITSAPVNGSRALTVGGTPKPRKAAVGFGPYRPVSRSKRAKNRRIEIVLFPQKVKFVRD